MVGEAALGGGTTVPGAPGGGLKGRRSKFGPGDPDLMMFCIEGWSIAPAPG